VLAKKVAVVAVCATAFVALASTQASAYPDRGSGSICSSGTSGTVCVHLETDIGSGHVRARLAVDANPGKWIKTGWVELDELTTERSTGQQTSNGLIDEVKTVTSTGSVESIIAGPYQEECDTKLATFQWRAIATYSTPVKGGVFGIETPWLAGAC
jgi:hypothetical protein